MLGLQKLFLALLVISSHVNLFPQIPGFSFFHQGVSAVIGFYILSGYFTSYILESKIKIHKKKSFSKFLISSKNFLIERFSRIAPGYYIYTFLTLIFLLLSNYKTIIWSYSAIISHITILPLNLHQFFYVSFFQNSDYALIPPGWYLGVLLQYYLLAPFLIKYPKLKFSTFIISSLIFITACLGIINTDYYVVRFGGNLIFLLIGDFIYQIHVNKKRVYKKLLFFTYISFYFLLSIIFYFKKQDLWYNGPVIIGLLLFLPITYFILKNFKLFSSFKKYNKFDRFLGTLSYEIFLNHFLLFWGFNYFQIANGSFNSDKWLKFALVTFTSVILAFFSLYLQKSAKKLIQKHQSRS
jgi:peptidoglycan/LPS O-acetylase OafA/YrhL